VRIVLANTAIIPARRGPAQRIQVRSSGFGASARTRRPPALDNTIEVHQTPTEEARSQAFNAAVPGIVAQKGPRPHLVDMHCNGTGAQRWFAR
jgi:hypothetical protein